MRGEPHPTRAGGLAATATTLVALVAMAATVSIAPAPRALELERLSESPVVRAVAAAVAAAARDLVGSERCTTTLALLEPSARCDDASASGPVASLNDSCPPPTLLGERLLDLPPPA
ncbi:MAG: hypothetical protein ACYS0G_06980 [Planctomycetota bacterium]|jgi:hypothetical protein